MLAFFGHLGKSYNVIVYRIVEHANMIQMYETES